jgi:hypothetical protein
MLHILSITNFYNITKIKKNISISNFFNSELEELTRRACSQSELYGNASNLLDSDGFANFGPKYRTDTSQLFELQENDKS